MAIQEMRLVNVFGNTSCLDSFIKNCCIDGNFQPEDAMEFLPKKMGFMPLTMENPYTDVLQMIEELSDEFGITTVHEYVSDLDDSEDDAEYFKQFLDVIHENYDKREELQKELENNKTLLENYEHFADMDINLKDIFDCEFTKFRFGYLPKESYEKLQMNIYKDNPFVTFMKGKEVKDGYWGAYIVPISKKEEIDNIFTKLSFERSYVPAYNGNAEDAIESIKEHNTKIEKEIEELTNQLEEYVKIEKEKYTQLSSKIKCLNTVYELKLYAAVRTDDSEDYFVYSGWICADYEDEFRKKVSEFDALTVEIDKPNASTVDIVPIKLRNILLFRPFSYFVQMFGLPSYNELDPTPLFAITYSIMFGLMFADLGQGLVVILIGYLMKKFKKMPLGSILMRCGIFSCIFGAVFGSVFGIETMLDGVYEKLGVGFLPIKVFENTTQILILAISTGIFLMLLVMIINTFCSLRLKKYADAIFSSNGLGGILTYISMVFLATKFMANQELKEMLNVVPSKLPLILLLVGLALMFMHEFVEEKIADKNYKLQIGNYILSNFIELFEGILSFFSNTVSYLRLGAFVLVHAGMMMVVTTLAGDKVNVTYIIVMILGNALVIALEALLTGIQSLRLEFYEMFSRYYSGQGKAFEPVNIYDENK